MKKSRTEKSHWKKKKKKKKKKKWLPSVKCWDCSLAVPRSAV